MKKEIVIKLEELLLKHKMTYQQLSDLTGLNLRTISDLVNNKVKRLPIDAICKIATVFNIDDIRELIDFKNEKK